MNGYGRGEDKNSNGRASILTKETVGMTLLLFSIVALLILATGPAVFGDVGLAIAAFFYGVCGFFVYPLLLLVGILSLKLISGKELISARILVRSMLLLTAIFFIVHAATSERFFLQAETGEMVGYGSYLAACWSAATERALDATGGGVLFGLLAYPIRLLSRAGSYVLYSALTAAALLYFLLLTPLGKRFYTRRPRKQQSKAGAPVSFDDLPDARPVSAELRVPAAAQPAAQQTAPQSPYEQRAPFAPESYSQRGGAAYPQAGYGDPYRNPAPETYPVQSAPKPAAPLSEREILYGGSPAESYRNNLIFDDRSAFNTQPRGSTVRPANGQNGAPMSENNPSGRPFSTSASNPSSDRSAPGSVPQKGYSGSFSESAEKTRDPMPRRVLPVDRDYRRDDAADYPDPARFPAEPTPPAEPPRIPEPERPVLRPDPTASAPRDLPPASRLDDPAGRVSDRSRLDDPADRFSDRRDGLNDLDGRMPRGDDLRGDRFEGSRFDDSRFDEPRGRELPPDDRSDPFAGRGRDRIEDADRFPDRSRFDDPADRSRFDEPADRSRLDDPAGRSRFDEDSRMPRGDDLRGRDRFDDSRFDDSRFEEPRGRELPADDREEPSSKADLFDGDGPDEGDYRAAQFKDDSRAQSGDESRAQRGLRDLGSRTPSTQNEPPMSAFDPTPPPPPPKPKKRVRRAYRRPDLNLFEKRDDTSAVSQEEIGRNSGVILDTLKSFKIEATISKVTCGSTVTRYDVEVPKNVPVGMVIKRDTEIGMRLMVRDGINMYVNNETGSVSIEVPNRKRATVGIRNVLSAPEYVNAKPGSLVFAIGKDIEGRNICGDIVKMKHLLVAGSTGSGKSVCLNTMLVSLICKYSPEELRLILIDPKRVEFAAYDGIPHLMINEIITDPPKAISALNWALKEMERRYGLFEQKTKSGGVAVQNIDQYNESLTEDEEKLCKIVIVFDELADFMMKAKKDIEERISTLTAKARAAGIHAVIATQRPSVDVITGVIKSNLPTRIAFRTIQANDSRIILDEMGAEKLLGMGDLLYRTEGMFNCLRVQGAFLSNKEIHDIVSDIKQHNESYYDEELTNFINQAEGDSEGSASAGEDGDGRTPDEYIEALAVVVKRGQASISLIQRSCGVGYNHAGKIVEWMETNHYISPFDGAKARTVLLTKEEFEAKYGPLD